MIHVASPDLRNIARRVDAVAALRTAYRNVLRAFWESKMRVLRMPVIASGIFVGQYKTQILQMTAEAMCYACADLPEAAAHDLVTKHIELCVYFGHQRVDALQKLLRSQIV